jgi:hypothetical protein
LFVVLRYFLRALRTMECIHRLQMKTDAFFMLALPGMLGF